MYKIAFFDARHYDRKYFDIHGRKNCISYKYFKTRLDSDTVGLARGYDGVCAFVNDKIDTKVINALSDCGIQLVALRCAGYNNVNLNAAHGKLCIMHVPAYSPHAVAEHAMAMLLTTVRKTHKAYNRTREFNFSLNGLTGIELHGKTVGIIGTGRIGRCFSEICCGFGMRIIASDPSPDTASGIAYTDIPTLLKSSDIISLHCPLTEKTRHIINAESLEAVKDGTVIVNTSRGELIDTEALISAIKSKKVSAACLDVYEDETDLFFEDRSAYVMQDDNLARLISMPNVLITSHQAYFTEEALDSIARITSQNISDFFNGLPLENEVKL